MQQSCMSREPLYTILKIMLIKSNLESDPFKPEIKTSTEMLASRKTSCSSLFVCYWPKVSQLCFVTDTRRNFHVTKELARIFTLTVFLHHVLFSVINRSSRVTKHMTSFEVYMFTTLHLIALALLPIDLLLVTISPHRCP